MFIIPLNAQKINPEQNRPVAKRSLHWLPGWRMQEPMYPGIFS